MWDNALPPHMYHWQQTILSMYQNYFNNSKSPASERLPRSNLTNWKSCKLKRRYWGFREHSYMELFPVAQDEEPALLEPQFVERKLLDAHHISISCFTGELSSRDLFGKPFSITIISMLILGLLHTFLRVLHIRNLMIPSVWVKG